MIDRAELERLIEDYVIWKREAPAHPCEEARDRLKTARLNLDTALDDLYEQLEYGCDDDLLVANEP